MGGPDNLTFNQLVDQIGHAVGRKPAVRHVPVPVMRLFSIVMRPFKPDVAGMIHAGISFDTVDMTFDATDLRRRFPQVELTPVADVIARRFAAGSASVLSRRTESRRL